jgi:hypothetical protein
LEIRLEEEERRRSGAPVAAVLAAEAMGGRRPATEDCSSIRWSGLEKKREQDLILRERKEKEGDGRGVRRSANGPRNCRGSWPRGPGVLCTHVEGFSLYKNFHLII